MSAFKQYVDPIQNLRTKLINTNIALLKISELPDEKLLPTKMREMWDNLAFQFGISPKQLKKNIPHLQWALEDVISMIDHVENSFGQASIEWEYPLPEIQNKSQLIESLQLIYNKLKKGSKNEENTWRDLIYNAYANSDERDVDYQFKNAINTVAKQVNIQKESELSFSPTQSEKKFFNLPKSLEKYILSKRSNLDDSEVFHLVNNISKTPTPMRKGIAKALEDIYANHILFVLSKIEEKQNFKKRKS